jgi:hypothetical protein
LLSCVQSFRWVIAAPSCSKSNTDSPKARSQCGASFVGHPMSPLVLRGFSKLLAQNTRGIRSDQCLGWTCKNLLTLESIRVHAEGD